MSAPPRWSWRQWPRSARPPAAPAPRLSRSWCLLPSSRRPGPAPSSMRSKLVSLRLSCQAQSRLEVTCRVPDAQRGEITIERLLGHRATGVGERRLRRRDVERRRLLRAIELERLLILRLGRAELLAGEAERRVGRAQVDERLADVLARAGLRILQRELRLLLALLRLRHAGLHFARLQQRDVEAERAVAVPARGERRLLIHPAAVERHGRQPEAALLLDLEAGDGE